MSKLSEIILSVIVLTITLSSCGNIDNRRSESTINYASSCEISSSLQDTNNGLDTDDPYVSSSNYDEPVEYLESAQKWINLIDNPEEVILSGQEIKKRNEAIRDRTNTLVDICGYGKSVTRDEIYKTLNNQKTDILPLYDRYGGEFKEEEYLRILDNRGIEMTEDFKPWRAVVSSRANLRSLPYKDELYSSKDDKCDVLQLTELRVGTPIWALHPSVDGKFFYVRSYNYEGWVDSECIALTENEEMWIEFAEPDRFVVVVSSMITVNGEKYDMGARIPIMEKKGNEYLIITPLRDAGGMLEFAACKVSSSDVHEGYLQYTYASVLNQAFKYEGTKYGWGGLNDGVDCSSFILNVFSTFGFVFPRDTVEQERSIGSPTSTMYMSQKDISNIFINSRAPIVIYYPEHTMLYIGNEEGKYSFIHAPKVGGSVCVAEKNNFKGVKYINIID